MYKHSLFSCKANTLLLWIPSISALNTLLAVSIFLLLESSSLIFYIINYIESFTSTYICALEFPLLKIHFFNTKSLSSYSLIFLLSLGPNLSKENIYPPLLSHIALSPQYTSFRFILNLFHSFNFILFSYQWVQ